MPFGSHSLASYRVFHSSNATAGGAQLVAGCPGQPALLHPTRTYPVPVRLGVCFASEPQNGHGLASFRSVTNEPRV
jgi:hypothetical protein